MSYRPLDPLGVDGDFVMTRKQRHNSPERLKQVALRPLFVRDVAGVVVMGGLNTGNCERKGDLNFGDAVPKIKNVLSAVCLVERSRSARPEVGEIFRREP